MPAGTAQRGQRSDMLDSLRGLAIGLVVAQHWFGFSAGWTGVDLFFVLSGYLIGGILIDNRESATYFRTFYMRRAFRILPLYWLLLTIALPTWGSRLPWWSYVTFTQNFYDAHLGLNGEVLEPTWSLAVEEQFYLMLPLLIRFLPSVHLLPVSLFLVLMGFLCRLPFVEMFNNITAAYVLLPCRMDSLFVGVAVACIARRPDLVAVIRRREWVVWTAGGIAAALFLLVGTSSGSGFAFGALPMVSFGYSLGALTYGSMLLALIFIRSAMPVWLPLRVLGIGAYSIYLFHLLFTDTIVAVTGLSWHIAALAAGVLSALFSVGCWRLIERPIIRWARVHWTYEPHPEPPRETLFLISNGKFCSVSDAPGQSAASATL